MDNQMMTFRECFSSRSGRLVLAYLLAEAGYFDANLKSSDNLAVLNYVKKHILYNIGIQHPSQAFSFVEKILDIPPFTKGVKKDVEEENY